MTSSDFDEPREVREDQDAQDMDDEEASFDPEEAASENAEALEPEAFGDEDELTAEDETLLEVKASIEQRLCQDAETINAAGIEDEDCYEGSGNIVGVGLGAAEDAESAGLEPGAPVLNIFLAESASENQVRSTLTDAMGIQAASDDCLQINRIVTGPIEADSHRFRIRPAPGGVSVGHFRITAGTLGCLAKGRRGSRRRRLLILSNNHVLANSNNARFGDSILQPGRADGGKNPRDRIAILERFVPINFGGRSNLVDCATGWAWPSRVRREQVYLRGGRRRFFRISSRTRNPSRGLLVGKSGRTTQLTVGRIGTTNATIRVRYGAGRVAVFRDQLGIRGLRGDFSRGGDSGSVIWSWDRRRNPVGLLFAGGGGWTFANKMQHVLRYLQISLYT